MIQTHLRYSCLVTVGSLQHGHASVPVMNDKHGRSIIVNSMTVCAQLAN
jgi:hypothetical protein